MAGKSPPLSPVGRGGILPGVVERCHGPRQFDRYRAGHGQAGRPSETHRRPGSPCGRLRHAPLRDRVLCGSVLCRGRQEYDHRAVAENALRDEDREDRESGRAAPSRERARSSDCGVACERRFPVARHVAGQRDVGRRSRAQDRFPSDRARSSQGSRPQRSRCLHRRGKDRGPPLVVPAGRSLPTVRRRARSTTPVAPAW